MGEAEGECTCEEFEARGEGGSAEGEGLGGLEARVVEPQLVDGGGVEPDLQRRVRPNHVLPPGERQWHQRVGWRIERDGEEGWAGPSWRGLWTALGPVTRHPATATSEGRQE